MKVSDVLICVPGEAVHLVGKKDSKDGLMVLVPIGIKQTYGWDDKSLQEFLSENVPGSFRDKTLVIKRGKFKGQKDIIGSVKVTLKGGGGIRA